MFAGSARQQLERDGDTAPVLEIVDHRGLAAAAKDKAVAQADAAKDEIARIADAVLGAADEAPLGDVWPAMGERMRTARLCKAKGRNIVQPHIISALTGGARCTRDNGQVVRMDIVRVGRGPTAPWHIRRNAAPVTKDA
jgi:hypothetical protein